MYISDISLTLEDIILQSDTKPNTEILDKSILSIIKDLQEINQILDLRFNEGLEINFLRDILFNNKEIDVYKIEDIHKLETLHELNILSLKYEKVILTKLFLSNPLDMNLYLLCYKQIHKKISIPKDVSIVSNMRKIKRFIYLILSNGMLMLKNKDNSSFISKQIRMRKQFEEGLYEKYCK